VNPKGYSLLLSGHIHLFEFVSLDENHPAQVVVGNGGTELATPLMGIFNGIADRLETTVARESDHQWGYTLFKKEGMTWNFVLKNPLGQALVLCRLSGTVAQCKSSGTDIDEQTSK
jgi:hypothetical protein